MASLLAEVGEVGQDKHSMTPQLETKLVYFQPESDTLEPGHASIQLPTSSGRHYQGYRAWVAVTY